MDIRDWPKVKGVYSDVNHICDILKQLVDDCEQNIISFSLVDTDNDISKNLARLDPMFMYTQIIKEILLTIRFEHKHFLDFTEHCQELLKDNKTQLEKVNIFEQNYDQKTPIW